MQINNIGQDQLFKIYATHWMNLCHYTRLEQRDGEV